MNINFTNLRYWACCLIILIVVYNSNAQNDEIEIDSIKPISTILAQKNDRPISERIDLYFELKKKSTSKSKLEEEMNRYGYNLLGDGKKDEALEIFKLLVAEFPNSANTYDSLAEVYLSLGNKDQALSNYEKTLAMDPDNFNAEDQIEKIKYPKRKKLSPKEKFHKVYTEIEYKEDLDQLGKTIKKVHPNALKFITEKEFKNLIEEKKLLINEATTYAEFVWHCSEIVASINCSHSNTDRFWQENQMIPTKTRFPTQTRLIDDKLYVVDPINNATKISIGDEILSINGIDIKALIQKIYPHISSQGYITTSKRHEFNMWSTGMIAYGLGLPNSYILQIKGKANPIILKQAKYHKDPKRDNSKEYCGGDLCLNYLDTEKKIASMTISSFNYYEWNNLSVFKKFIDESMVELSRYGTEQLIIDLRGNGGGSPESSIHLLKYLIHDPFVYYSKVDIPGKTQKAEGEKVQMPFENGFNGKLSFIMDGKGNSTTGHFMSLVKIKNLGIIIGEELGSNQFCSADRKRCRLSNTKLEYNLAINTHVSTATSLPDEVGILPDHYVSQSISDYIARVDAVKQYTIDLITKEMNWRPASKLHHSYFLDANDEWTKELFQIPLDFASDMTLKGIEDARFPSGWGEKEGDTFWSYSFAWNIEHSQPLSINEINHNLELYFNGLMRIKDKVGVSEITESTANFKMENQDLSSKLQTYTGQVETLDAFFERKPMTLNVMAEQQFCEEIQRAVIIFRLSPQSFESNIWNKLAKVKLPNNICEP